MPRKRVFVRGRVQGVAFRYYTQQTATRLGIRGWIRNCSGGRQVEIVAEAEDEALASFLTWCHKGPPHARVDTVEVVDEPEDEAFETFSVRHTY